jgi:hypothetical protein
MCFSMSCPSRRASSRYVLDMVCAVASVCRHAGRWQWQAGSWLCMRSNLALPPSNDPHQSPTQSVQWPFAVSAVWRRHLPISLPWRRHLPNPIFKDR